MTRLKRFYLDVNYKNCTNSHRRGNAFDDLVQPEKVDVECAPGQSRESREGRSGHPSVSDEGGARLTAVV